MTLIDRQSGLFTDHYELTMAQGFFLSGKAETPARFDYFFRKSPFMGSYVIFAGLQNLLEMLTEFAYDREAREFLESRGFDQRFTEYLAGFRFSGNIWSAAEGEIVFPNEPVLSVEGNIIECQLIESMVLNILNFESLIATKASRIKHAAGDREFIDFGLRRAQGTGAMQASRAAVIGGASGTSNVLAAYKYGLRSTGTQAHSWIQSFSDELTAFREFAGAFPDSCILLVDTYNTLGTGVPNAIRVAKEMERAGYRLKGIRLDSGDLAYLSKKARKMLDTENLEYVKIIASNQLDEYVIRSLREQNAPIDAFGVGTNLVTGKDDAALDGVYKLVYSEGRERLKISDNIEKMILPGKKRVFRYSGDDGSFYADGVSLGQEDSFRMIYHPFNPEKKSDISNFQREEIVVQVMNNGKPLHSPRSIDEIAEYARERLIKLPAEHKRFEYPHIYKVGISEKLMETRDRLVKEIKKNQAG
ncbi:MAG: nicotinate phosphoribosyltransferase [Marinilabiliales bacterium]|nr:MAG: nicotinate phosphoribosyltransferase [Marinilabiliales bacterium]